VGRSLHLQRGEVYRRAACGYFPPRMREDDFKLRRHTL